ncbi:MAG: hypothetical protein ACR2PK_05200 [Acidimicrobiales bacterium]
MRTLYFEPVERSRRQLVLRYRIDNTRFSTSYWYDTVDFIELEATYGSDFMRWVEFHLLAFEANKAASLKPDKIDFGSYADLVTDEFWDLWETIFRNVWAVWRFENDLPDYRLVRPDLGVSRPPPATSLGPPEVPTLMLCGGGKDSLVSMGLLETADIQYDAFVYSHSTYGRGQHQHDLIDGVLEHCDHQNLHRGWVFDDAIDSPAALVEPELGIGRMIAAETVSSYWTALPLILQHRYRNVALGISRSTDEHNLTWDRNGEDVNYLWGMSSTAETLLHDYVRQNLVTNVQIFHILRPIYDIGVFTLLGRNLDAVPATHSCAQVKPWCCRCAKCIYVWMNYVAWLPQDVVAETFSVNLFDLEENRSLLRKMLGLESYKPTDCVGTVSEARLAFVMCRMKDVSGVIADEIDLGPLLGETEDILDRYSPSAELGPTFPKEFAPALDRQFRDAATSAHAYARELLAEK